MLDVDDAGLCVALFSFLCHRDPTRTMCMSIQKLDQRFPGEPMI